MKRVKGTTTKMHPGMTIGSKPSNDTSLFNLLPTTFELAGTVSMLPA